MKGLSETRVNVSGSENLEVGVTNKSGNLAPSCGAGVLKSPAHIEREYTQGFLEHDVT